jgi:hypothetical protein
MGIILKRQIIWRAIVTPKLKQEIAEELEEAAGEVDQRIQQLEFAARPYLSQVQAGDLTQILQIRRQVEAEKKRQQAVRDELLQRKQQVLELEDGTEVIRGLLEGWVEVEVGDDLTKALAGVEIVTKDNVVVEIRESAAPKVAPAAASPTGAESTPGPVRLIVPGQDG